jgi:XTP/dITP diphosphohydrolase
MERLLLATGNAGKAREYRDLLRDLSYEVVTLADLGITTVVEETGVTFEENAHAKATAMAAESGLLAMADDSGLEVDALGGEPGTRSHRYAGEGASDQDRINRLLTRMQGVPWPERTARFRCVIAIAEPGGTVATCAGECPGMIATEPHGEGGFGYDPIFYISDLGRTMAQITLAEKNRISHRGHAGRAARRLLAERSGR